MAVLASDVVNGNPANAEYQGEPLGNLADQSSRRSRATVLEDLVGKWFEGTDLPAIHGRRPELRRGCRPVVWRQPGPDAASATPTTSRRAAWATAI